jgi:hypothetical protein
LRCHTTSVEANGREITVFDGRIRLRNIEEYVHRYSPTGFITDQLFTDWRPRVLPIWAVEPPFLAARNALGQRSLMSVGMHGGLKAYRGSPTAAHSYVEADRGRADDYDLAEGKLWRTTSWHQRTG